MSAAIGIVPDGNIDAGAFPGLLGGGNVRYRGRAHNVGAQGVDEKEDGGC